MKIKQIPGYDGGELPEEILLVDTDESEKIALGYISVNEGERTTARTHDDEEEIYVVLKGKAKLTIGDETQDVGPGSVAYVPRNKEHFFECTSDEKLEYLYFANWPD